MEATPAVIDLIFWEYFPELLAMIDAIMRHTDSPLDGTHTTNASDALPGPIADTLYAGARVRPMADVAPDAHRAFTTRRVPDDACFGVCTEARRPRSGDLVLARVDEIHHHTRLHQPDGRRRQLFEGDHVIVAYADRYAPSSSRRESRTICPRVTWWLPAALRRESPRSTSASGAGRRRSSRSGSSPRMPTAAC